MNRNSSPPQLLLRFFRWYCHPDYQEDIEGDLLERFERRVKEKGTKAAKWGFFTDVMRLFRPGIIRSLEGNYQLNKYGMIKNNIKIAIRTAIRQKGYSAINLFGLTVGMACFTVIMLYIHDELSYDQFHNDADRIYRVVKDRVDPDVSHSYVPSALMPAMLHEIPEVDQGVRFLQWNKGELSYGDKAFYESSNLYVENTFFDVFSFSFVQGNTQTALTSPSSIVLTERMAAKYFGDDDALGKTLTFKNQNMVREYQVSGVIENVPSQSHFTFDFLFSISGFPHRQRADVSWDDNEMRAHTYIKINAAANIKDIETKIQKLVETNKPENVYVYSTQPLVGLNGIHMDSHRSGELQANSNKFYIKVLLMVALFVILIACINYINLATARSAIRIKEIGVRKVVGARRSNLIWQFLIESVLMLILAGVMTIGLTESILFFFNTIMQKELSLFAESSLYIWILIAAIVAAMSILAGLYPAFYLSALKPSILKNLRTSSKARFSFRQGLVLFQFGLAALLMISIVVIQNQLSYINSVNLGFDKDQVIIISNSWQLPNRDRGFVVRNALEELPGVLKASAGVELGATRNSGSFHQMRAKGSDKVIDIAQMEGDQNFLDVFGLELVEGRNLSPVSSIEDFKIILNETAVKQLGLKAPVAEQKVILNNKYEVPVIGVVKDFHSNSLHTKISPLYLSCWNPEALTLAVKLSGGDIQETLKQIEKIWDKHAPGSPLNFHFLDSVIERQYRSEQNFRSIFLAMTGLSLVIACLGLFGLAAFTVEQRTKEIGIRKVLGASIINLISLLSKEFILLIGLANLVAWPIAYFAMSKWLENFAYKVNIGWGVFLISGVAALMIAMLTVSSQTIKITIANPVDALKDE